MFNGSPPNIQAYERKNQTHSGEIVFVVPGKCEGPIHKNYMAVIFSLIILILILINCHLCHCTEVAFALHVQRPGFYSRCSKLFFREIFSLKFD